MKIKLLIFFYFILNLGLISSCTVYKSEGRKTFENQAPGQIKALSFDGCSDQIHPSFSESESETLWTPQGKPVQVVKWGKEIRVFVPFVIDAEQKVCSYTSANLDSWLRSKETFFIELDSISTN